LIKKLKGDLMSVSPRKVSEISFDWLKESLKVPFPNSNLTAMDIDASMGDLGYLGVVCRVTITFDSNDAALPASLILKFPPSDAESFSNGSQLGAYATEAGFYLNMADKGVGRAPRHYFSVVNPAAGEFLLAMEDLKDLRFVKQTDGASFDDCKVVMRALADMHADHWEASTLKNDWLRDIKDWRDSNAPLIESGMPLMKENFSDYIDHPGFLANWDAGAAAYGDVCAHLSSGPCTLMHGDAHIRNVAFEDGHEQPVRFYDWQLCCRGPAAYDLLYFFVNSLTVADQEQHLEQLIHEYYFHLSQRVSDYTRDDLMRDMGYCSLTFWGFSGWLGNILPPNEATIELVKESFPRYFKLMDYLDSSTLLQQFSPSK
jgi:hypothetical protein